MRFKRPAKKESSVEQSAPSIGGLGDEEVPLSVAPFNPDSALVAVPVEAIPTSLPLACTLYIRVNEKVTLFRRQGEQLTRKRVFDLTSKGATTLYMHKSFWAMFMESLEGMQVPEAASMEQQVVHIRHLLVAYGQELERRLKQPKKPYFEKLQSVAAKMATFLHKDATIGLNVVRRDRDPMVYFANHAVNTAIYSMLVAKKMGYGLEDLQQLCYAALVHEIGQFSIPRTIVYKPTALTPAEEEIMQSHPRRGAELLESMQAPGNVIQAIYQHHERWDGKGYPNRLAKERIHPFARIIAIADTYDALTSHRPFRPALKPGPALMKMLSFTGQHDPNILAVVGEKQALPTK